MMPIDQSTTSKLDELALRGDAGRVPYYKTLIAAGDPYAKLALGVVLQDQMARRVAYSYAVEVGKRYCKPISSSGWTDLSVALMKADLAARKAAKNFEPGKPSLLWNVIRDYHAQAFNHVAHLPPQAWTAWIPLLIVGDAKAEALWHRMLTENFLHVAVETAKLVLQRAAQEAGVSRELHQTVAPQLKIAPPVVFHTPSADTDFQRCMVRLASEQLHGRVGTPQEQIALFYLSCLALGAHVELPPLYVTDPYGPGPTPTYGDVDRLHLH